MQTKEETAAYQRQYQIDNREVLAAKQKVYDQKRRGHKRQYERDRWPLSAYKLSSDEYRDLIANGCAVCGSMEKLEIDHDHNCCPGPRTCGKCVRGVLCGKHNRTLGLVNDSVEELLSLVAYLTTNE